MQAKHSRPQMEISSFSLKRRGFLAGTAAATIAIGAPLAAEAVALPADNFDLMRFEADTHAEMLDELAEVDRQSTALLDAPGAVPHPRLTLRGFLGAERVATIYIGDDPDEEFGYVMQVDLFFGRKIRETQRAAPWSAEAARALPAIIEDRDRMRAAVEAMTDAHEGYLEASGYNALEKRSIALSEASWAIEDRVWAMPCRSRRDIALKLELMDRWLAGTKESGGDSEYLRAILGSIRDFANTNSSPSAASGLLVADRGRP